MPPRKREDVRVFEVRQEVKDSDPDRVAVATTKTVADAPRPAHVCPKCGHVGQMKVAPAATAAPAPTATALPARYRVTRGGSFVWRGSICNVQTGDVVALNVYGAAGLDNMRGRGIVLEPLAG